MLSKLRYLGAAAARVQGVGFWGERDLAGMMSLFLSKYARHVQLLLILVAAVGGLLFLFDVFVGLISSGPTDLLTAGEPDERQVGLPSGGTLAEALAFGLALALAAGAAYLPIDGASATGCRCRTGAHRHPPCSPSPC